MQNVGSLSACSCENHNAIKKYLKSQWMVNHNLWWQLSKLFAIGIDLMRWCLEFFEDYDYFVSERIVTVTEIQNWLTTNNRRWF